MRSPRQSAAFRAGYPPHISGVVECKVLPGRTSLLAWKAAAREDEPQKIGRISGSPSEVQRHKMGLQERTGSAELPTRIVVRDCGMMLDGGTILLSATDEAGRQVSIVLA